MGLINNNTLRLTLKICWFVIVVTVLLVIVGGLTRRPSHNRVWMPDQSVLPNVLIDSDSIHIQFVRNYTWRSFSDYDPIYDERTYDLNKIKRVWFLVEPFQVFGGMAHTLMSFEFEGGRFVAVSIETRREVGEERYSAWKGLFRRYELMYIIADESDVIKLRTNIRKSDVYLHPIIAPQEKVRDLFLDVMERAQSIYKEPEFYNTLTNNCTSNLVRHVRRIAPGGLPRSIKLLLPGFSDAYAYELGLIDTSLPFEEVRKRHAITPQAQTCASEADFSACIRAGL